MTIKQKLKACYKVLFKNKPITTLTYGVRLIKCDGCEYNLKCDDCFYRDFAKTTVKEISTEAVNKFAESFLKKVHDNHYMLSDQINSKDYGMFTIGIEQAVNETKEEMSGEK